MATVKPHKIPLKILNASAGSGKTYHLVKSYISLLIGEEAEKDAFSRMIAMTFTNKAALEMKERIISSLDQISAPEHFNDSARHLILDLSESIGISPDEVEARARKALKSILHRYEDFHVMTIDKFNLRLIKSFGRDLDIPSDFEVILDESELIERVVDDLLNQLGDGQHSVIDKLIFRYATSKIDEGNAWNFRGDLIKFGALLNSEKNNALVDRLLSMNFSKDQYEALIRQRTSLDQQFSQLRKNLQMLLDQKAYDYGMLPGGNHTKNDIQRIANMASFPLEKELIKTRLSKNMGAGDAFPSELSAALNRIQDFWASHLEEYAAVHLFLKHFFNMALLQFIAAALKRIKKEEQLIRISEFNTLISGLIQQENAPFIYERLGTRLRHFLLDEFQDTSRLQWLNLVPLVHNAISQNADNLIVGDPKQSIYRFKNGVAEQFVALPEIYNPEAHPMIAQNSSYFKQMGSVEELVNNWRSSATIVCFNNTFFAELRNALSEQAQSFYNAVHQIPQSSKNGYVKIISKEEKLSAEQQVPIIKVWIEECLEDGFQPGDICILGGTNKTCNLWAVGLTNSGYKVVSSDSLLIDTSLRVQLTIAYLHWRLKPGGEYEKKRFAELYFRTESGACKTYHTYIKEATSHGGKPYRYFDSDRFIRDAFGADENFFFSYENTYDLVEKFYRLMGYNELSNPYLHHLADVIFEFGQKKGPDLRAFLEHYATKKHKIAVQIPESPDAIKIMTIHKSKGLEFPVVMLPSMNFSLDIKSDMLLDSGDFIVYKRPGKNELLREVAAAYREETDQILTDCINMCYVGMTRPEERLYVHNAFEKNTFGAVFHNAITTIKDAQHREDAVEVERGTRTRSAISGESFIEAFTPHDVSEKLWFPDIALQDQEELREDDYLSEQVQFGVQFHLLASLVDRMEDVEKTTEELVGSGRISVDHKDALAVKLNALFSNTSYQQLFKGSTHVLNEQAIIVDERTTIRPDKVILKPNSTIVVDFKTGAPNSKDERQVKHYADVFSQMGYPQVEGYIFYTSLMELRLLA